MRVPSVAVAVLLLLSVASLPIRADEKGDALLKKTLETAFAAQPLTAEFTVTTQVGEIKTTDFRRSVLSGTGSSFYGGLPAFNGKMPDNGSIPAELRRVLPLIALDPLPVRSEWPSRNVPKTARYLGSETVEGVTYQVLEVRDWLSPKPFSYRLDPSEKEYTAFIRLTHPTNGRLHRKRSEKPPTAFYV
jgi:hypothetical protein